MPVNKLQLIVATRTIKRMRVGCLISNNQLMSMHCNFYYYRKKQQQIMKIIYDVIVIGIV